MQEQSCIIEELPADEEPASTQQDEDSSPTASTSTPADASAAAAAGAQQGAPSAADQAAASAEPSTEPPASEEPAASEEAAAPSSSSNSPPEQEQQEGQPVDAEQVQQLLVDCERLKQEGNAAYTRGDYDEALQLYWQAIDTAPEGAQQRAVYLCNAAACYLKKEMWQLAVEQCTAALSINDTYLKALMRRAQALQQLDDLERALPDAQRVLELDPGNSWATQVVKELQPEVQQRQEKMKEEMIGKLKDLGNSILGKFGMSLDNFKAEQDPESGGYSIKFVQ